MGPKLVFSAPPPRRSRVVDRHGRGWTRPVVGRAAAGPRL